MVLLIEKVRFPKARPRLTSPIEVLLVALVGLSGCRAVHDVPGDSEEHLATERTAAERLLDRSITFHDPDGVWNRVALPLRWTSARPDGEVALDFEIDLFPNDAFAMRGRYGDALLNYRASEGTWSASLDGESELSAEDRAKAGLVREDGFFWRNYFGFLGGMPMCLKDPNVQIESDTFEVELEGKTVLALRANFHPEVGADTWIFYFDSETAQLVGCCFYREDPTGDGETLIFEELVSVAGIRLPKRRTWYTNAEREMLGIDELSARTE